MFRVIVQLSCMIVLASVLYDIFSCVRFNKTCTYKYVMYVGNSKYGKIFLKKLKKVRRICFKSLGWFSCNPPIDNRAAVNQVKPCMHFTYCSWDLKNNVISLIHYVVVCFGEKISLFRHPILSCNHLATVANVVVAGACQKIWKCKQTTMEFMTKIMPLR